MIDPNGDVQETMDQGLTAMQGAGVVNAMHMCTILVQKSYISGNFTGASYMTEISLLGRVQCGGYLDTGKRRIQPHQWHSDGFPLPKLRSVSDIPRRGCSTIPG